MWNDSLSLVIYLDIAVVIVSAFYRTHLLPIDFVLLLLIIM